MDLALQNMHGAADGGECLRTLCIDEKLIIIIIFSPLIKFHHHLHVQRCH